MNIIIKMKLLLLIYLAIVVDYAHTGETGEERSIKKSNKIKFEDDLKTDDTQLLPQATEARQYGLIYEDPNHPLRFQNEGPSLNYNSEEQKKKRKRRRRKPKNQGIPNPGYPGYPRPGEVYPGEADPYYNPGYEPPSGGQRPYSQPPKSIASEAFSSILSALTSTALYDDKQCVPRMLCEAAGGGALGSSNLLQSVTGLQPLLTLLSAYNGITSSPLFVFGRAVFLGMTSKGNPGTCRYAYPYCPTDPEQLVHYLNNHNGGFFRFFNAPQLSRPQDLEQFYNQLSGQGYGLYQPSGNGHQANQYGLQGNLYSNQNGYGSNYNYDSGYKGFEERIQNRPSYVRDDNYDNDNDDDGSRWRFPDDLDEYNDNHLHNEEKQTNRGSRTLKFPDQNTDSSRYQPTYADDDYNYRREKNVKFVEHQYNNRYQDPRINHKYYLPNSNNYNQNTIRYDGNYNNFNSKYPKDTRVNNDDYEFDHVHNFYVKKNKEEGLKTVYIVRGNGDPNHPEIVRVRPGESISK